MVKISQKIIEKAYSDGNAVIVGRGSQCVLQHKPDVFHVFVYAPSKSAWCASATGWKKVPTSSSAFAP